jgi:hypothetical protein
MSNATSESKMGKSKSFTEADAAALLGCNVKALRSRMVFLGYTKACGRCGGSGRYSFNQIDGDKCYGCNGKRNVILPITRKLAVEMKARQDAGELAPYFARIEALKAAKARIAPLVAEARALCKPIGDAYGAEYQRKYGKGGNLDHVFDERLAAMQRLASEFYFGAGLRGVRVTGLAQMGVSEIEFEIQQGWCTDYERAATELAERVEMIRAVRAAFDAAYPSAA